MSEEKKTCMDRYKSYAEIVPIGCVENNKKTCKGCPERSGCEIIWDRVCAACSIYRGTPMGSCNNMDETARNI